MSLSAEILREITEKAGTEPVVSCGALMVDVSVLGDCLQILENMDGRRVEATANAFAVHREIWDEGRGAEPHEWLHDLRKRP